MKNRWIAGMAAVLLAASFGTVSLAEARTSASIQEQVFINGNFQEDAIVEKGRALIPLRSLNDPNWLSYNYDTKTHMVTAKSKDGSKVIKLKAGSLSATVNGKQVKLDTRVVNKQGRTFVPLRFVSEALGGYAYYNNKDKRVIIRTPAGQKAYQTLMKGDLTAARNIALHLPPVMGKLSWAHSGEGFTTYYKFPEGQALQYSVRYKGVTDHIKVNQDGIAEVIYQEDDLNGKHKAQGTKPTYTGGYIYFTDNWMGDTLEYGKTSSTGEETALGSINYTQQPKYKGNVAVLIEGEERTDIK